MVLVPLGVADVVGHGWPRKDDEFHGSGQQNGFCRLQSPVGGGVGGVACLQDSYLMSCCWG